MKLMKRLAELKTEKETLANEVEQEEEFLINNLQKRLTKLNTEKADLERQLETEQVGACITGRAAAGGHIPAETSS